MDTTTPVRHRADSDTKGTRKSKTRDGMPRPRLAGPACRRIVGIEFLFESLGTGVERQPDAERLLARRTFGPLQLPCDLRGGGLLLRHRFEITNFGCSPRAPLLLHLRHKTSLSRKAACIPYGSEKTTDSLEGHFICR
jgi:hypothetical protein